MKFIKPKRLQCITRSIALCLISTTLVFSSVTLADRHIKPLSLETLTRKLDLSQAQQQQLKDFSQQKRNKMSEVKQQRQDLRTQMESLVKAEQFDEAAIRVLLLQNQADFVNAKLEKARFHHHLWQILEPSQQKKLNRFQKRNSGRMMKPPMHHMKLLKRLDLSNEQKSTIRSLMQATLADFDPFQDGSHVIKDSVLSISRTSNFDSLAVTDLITESYRAHTDKMVERLKLRHQIWHVLNAGQQQKYELLQQKYREKRQVLFKSRLSI
jgi:protein CpxP